VLSLARVSSIFRVLETRCTQGATYFFRPYCRVGSAIGGMGNGKRQKTASRLNEESCEDLFMRSLSDGHMDDIQPISHDSKSDISVIRNKRVAALVRSFVHVNRSSMEESTLRKNTLSVSTLSSGLISELLHEPYARLTANGSQKVCPPACMNDRACLGRSVDITGLRQASPAALCAWMSQHEWDDMTTNGSVPIERRRCVLCESYNVQLQYNNARLMAPRDINTSRDDFMPHNMQAFCVRVDESGGYKSKYCIPFSNDSCALGAAGVLCPIIMPQLSLLENRYAASGVRYVCQRRLLYEYDEDAMQYF
jgi:hypothetical protein